MIPRPAAAYLLILAAAALLSPGCGEREADQLPPLIRPVEVRPAESYPVWQRLDGLTVAATPFAAFDAAGEPGAAPAAPATRDPLGRLDLGEAGVLPVHLVVWNDQAGDVELETGQILGVAGDTLYRTYPEDQAASLVIGSQAFRLAVKGERIMPLLRGLFDGELVGQAARVGVERLASTANPLEAGHAAARAAGTTGIEEVHRVENGLAAFIRSEYATRALRSQLLHRGWIADGMVFVPSHRGVTALRLSLFDRTRQLPVVVVLDLAAAAARMPTQPTDQRTALVPVR